MTRIPSIRQWAHSRETDVELAALIGELANWDEDVMDRMFDDPSEYEVRWFWHCLVIEEKLNPADVRWGEGTLETAAWNVLGAKP